MSVLIIVLVIFLLIIVGAVVALLIYSKKLKQQAEIENMTGTEIKEGGISVQQFLPFKSIKNGIVDLGNFEYRTYIECSSVNYGLKTQMEQEVLEKSFQRFVNSFTFPFAFYIQTREIDAREIIRNTEKDVQNINKNHVGKDYDGLKSYAQKYLESIIDMNERLSGVKQKKKYIIITYDDAASLTELSDEEKEQRAYEQIILRTNSVISSLAGIGIHGHRLEQKEVVELIFRALNKDSIGALDGLVDGEFTVPIVEGSDNYNWEYTNPAAKLDILIANLLSGLESEIITDNRADEVYKETARAVYDDVSKLRKKYAGWYKRG